MKKIGFDIGSRNLRVVTEEGILRTFPAVMAADPVNGAPLAFGFEAEQLASRTPGCVKLVYPFESLGFDDSLNTDSETVAGGAASNSDFSGPVCGVTPELLSDFLRYALDNASDRRLHPREIAIALPGDQTDEKEQLCFNACTKAGAREVFVVDTMLAAAYGANANIDSDIVIVNAGASVCDMGVYSYSKLVDFRSVPAAGSAFDLAVRKHVFDKYRISVTSKEAEAIKIEIGSVEPSDSERECLGLGLKTSLGLPRRFRLRSGELLETFEPVIGLISDGLIALLNDLRFEPVKIILTGGSAMLPGLAEALTETTGITSAPAYETDCDCCVAWGVSSMIADGMLV